MKSKRAFTLIELLVVVAIIAVLALLATVAASSFQRRANMTQSLNNLKQLASGLLNYTASNSGQFPALGVAQPGFGKADDFREAWYNVVPKAAGAKGLHEYSQPADFYNKANLLFLPAAKYPESKLSRPLFAIAINELLYGDSEAREEEKKNGSSPSSVRMVNMVAPMQTVVFVEVGLQGEPTLPGQSNGNYLGSAHGGPSNIVARYSVVESGTAEERRESQVNMVFGDGHVEAIALKDLVDESSKPYHPQLQKNGGKGLVSWTLDPESNATK